MFNFKVLAEDKKSKARVGKIVTSHGVVDTPAFVPVGTQATVKSLTPQDLKETGTQILFGNTYHLHLRPGEDAIKDFGGLAKFMGWNKPIMTDSGGFQVFSLGRVSLSSRLSQAKPGAWRDLFHQTLLSKIPRLARNDTFRVQHDNNNEQPRLVKISDDGVIFRSHLDGSLHNFTPEESIEIQKKLGADIILAFDECVPHPSTHKYTKEAMERTHKWAVRNLAVHKLEIRNSKSETISNAQNSNNKNVSTPRRWPTRPAKPWRSGDGFLRGGHKQALYGIIQGGVYKDLREQSAKFISSLPFDGIAIGGVAVGESKKEMLDVLDWTVPLLPDNKPRHLLGVGEIDDIFEIIERGIDTFDCVLPTRLGRVGFIFISPPEGNLKNRFRIDITKSKFAKDKRPIAKDCNCSACKTFIRGYLNHLFRARELLAYRLATYHNLYFINNLVRKIRHTILEGRFERLKTKWIRW